MTFPPFAWPPVASSQSSTPSSTVLTVDADLYVDPINGSDSAAGTQAAPWLTIARFHAFLNAYVQINATASCTIVVASLESPPTADFDPFSAPPIGQLGRIVYRADLATTAVFAEGPAFTAEVGSLSSAILSNDFPSGERAGYQIRCVSGENVGCLRTVMANSGAAPATIVPAGELVGSGEGDTWQLFRPAATINFVNYGEGTVYMGGESGAYQLPSSYDGMNASGIYFFNLRIIGAPRLGRGNFWIYGCEYDDATESIRLINGCNAGFGIAQVGALPWLGIDDGPQLRGYALSQRYDTLGPASFARLLRQGFVNTQGLIVESYAAGYVVGTQWQLLQKGSHAWLHGGRLWGNGSGDSFYCQSAWASLGTVQGQIPMRISNEAAGGRCVHAVHSAYCEVNAIDFSGPNAFLKAEGLALIDCDTGAAGAPLGNCTAEFAYDARSWGMIRFVGFSGPQITGNGLALGWDGVVDNAAGSGNPFLNAALTAPNTIVLGVDAGAQPLPVSWVGHSN